MKFLWLVTLLVLPFCEVSTAQDVFGSEDTVGPQESDVRYRVIRATVKSSLTLDDYESKRHVLTLEINSVASPPIGKDPDHDGLLLSAMEVRGRTFLNAKKGQRLNVVSRNLKTENDHVVLILSGKKDSKEHDTFLLRTFSNR